VELYAVASSKDMFPSCDTVWLVGGEKSSWSCTRWHRRRACYPRVIQLRWLAERRAGGAIRGGIVDVHVALV
jgi:hypothetical protein